jgi:DNA polymerase (family 10)
MEKSSVAAILDEIGTLLELQGENPFRCLAYHNAARAVEQMEEDLGQVVAAGRLSEIQGIGATLQEKITTLVQTGELAFYTDLKQKVPAGLVQMLRLPGIGPKKVKALFDQIGIQDLDQLRLACLEGRVAGLRGFGAKTQEKILAGIDFLGRVGQRVRIDQAQQLALPMLEALRDCPGLGRIELCGSLRRRKETVQDIDILASASDPGTIMDRFALLPGVVQIVGRGDTKSSIVLEHALSGGRRVLMNADLRVVRDEQFPFALHYFTGSKEHNIALRGLAQPHGLKLNEYELSGPEGSVPCKDEADIFRTLGLDYVPPEMREGTGEIEAALQQRLPALIEPADLRGTFHCHTTWSDGTASAREMAEAARKLGFEYLGIADHSQSLTVASGLTPERVHQQLKEIDALNSGLEGFRIFKGTECDILADGRLDFDDALLAEFDYVVASVHSHFNQSAAEMTARIVRAMSNPHVTMLGHPTGRLLLERDGYKVDMEAVFQAATRYGTIIEINADPHRLDVDWVQCKRAKALGLKLVINPDAHSTSGLASTHFGVDVARRGWLESQDVFNTLTADQVADAFAVRRSR